jgi:hypothetical protein
VYSGDLTFLRTPGGPTLTKWFGAVYAAEHSTFDGITVDIGDLDDPRNRDLLAQATQAALNGTDLPIPPGTQYSRFTESTDGGNWEVSGTSSRIRDLTSTQRDSLALVQHTTRDAVRTETLFARGENGEEVGLGATESRNTFFRDGVSPTPVKVFTDLGEYAPFGNTEAVKVIVDSYVDGGGAGSTVTVKTPGTVYQFNEDDLYGRARQIVDSGDPAAGNPLIQELNKGFGVAYAVKNATASWMPFTGATNEDITAAFDALARFGPPTPLDVPDVADWTGSAYADLGLDWAQQTGSAELPSDYLMPAVDFTADFSGVSVYDGAAVVTTEGW